MSPRARALGMMAALLAAGAAAAPPEAERPAVRAERPSKPTGPIAVTYRLTAEPQVGVPLTIAISARTAAGADLALEATASRPEALVVEPPLLAAAAEGLFEWRVTVVPLASDAGFLNALVAGEVDGVAQARSVAVPLRVAAAPDGRAGAAQAGETLIALPVEERR